LRRPWAAYGRGSAVSLVDLFILSVEKGALRPAKWLTATRRSTWRHPIQKRYDRGCDDWTQLLRDSPLMDYASKTAFI
jgi:hypothetical protein